ncbi:MAG: nitroreductase family protein [Clostridia bacterium]|nr:nitroreductase family protein [Clostridia bacterium]
MDFLQLAKDRYSCRYFSEKEIEQEKIDKILEAARLAPTGRNSQSQKILILTDKEELSKLGGCTPYGWNAPLVMLICYDKNESWKRRCDGADGGIIDMSIITTHMMLEVTNLDLGATWIGAFDPIKAREIYNIPENYELAAILPIGYPAEDAHPSKLHNDRKTIEEFAFYNKF